MVGFYGMKKQESSELHMDSKALSSSFNLAFKDISS